MRLSEAVMLGSVTPKVKFSAWDYDHCLIGVAVHVFHDKAIGSGEAFKEAMERWPWLETQFPIPAGLTLSGDGSRNGEQIVSCFAFDIVSGKATLEQAVDWIRSVEPAEPELEVAEPVEIGVEVNG